jgi:hypothetical protein
MGSKDSIYSRAITSEKLARREIGTIPKPYHGSAVVAGHVV